MKELLVFLNKVPGFLKKGPWTPVAYAALCGLFIFLVYSREYALLTFNDAKRLPSDEAVWLQWLRLSFGVYGALLTVGLVYAVGYLPLASYTITSWNLLTLRMICAYIGSAFKLELFEVLAVALRFPALVGSTVTVIVWWIILVPLIYGFLEEGEQTKRFIAFNSSFFLVNVHLLVLPIAAAEFIGSSSPLCFFDLWMGLVVAFVYVLFYLNVLDPAGLHFYIILSPRTVFCIFSYALIIGLYWAFFHLWNHILSNLEQDNLSTY